MRNAVLLFFAGLFIVLSSCRKDFEFQASTGDLQFSRDTVYLDTVFTNIGSSTYTLKVYNRSDNDINIPTIQLGKGLDSKYRMTVDGMTGTNGKIFNNVELLAKDSLFIFIETTASIADANADDFLYTDQIRFDNGSNLQTVELVTLIQDAVFLYPQRFDDGTTETLQIGEDSIYGFFLDENDPIHGNEYTFTNEKPYVIYGYAAVANGKTLNIQPGARVHFHDSSGIIVAQGGSLHVGAPNTTPTEANQVVFEGDRLEPGFSDVPGQWGAIWLTPGSIDNQFNNVTIKNAVIGLYIQQSDATLNNTQIYDCSNFGILAQTATITGQNVVANNAGQATLACTLGGSYAFRHCTFNNNWPSSKQAAVVVDNYYKDENNAVHAFALTQAQFDNCIIYGSNSRELALNKSTEAAFTYQFNNCLIKFINTGFEQHAEYQFTDPAFYNNIVRNENPDFKDINQNELIIGAVSGANGIGNAAAAALVPYDLLGVPRVGVVDAGAYQHITFED
ncbi:MAG: hypothetical protein EOO51_00585 [Flavobacterium sp.]|nr:MAG: hypothetical protein EOO51_00585 [Flavobacterium sp.]